MWCVSSHWSVHRLGYDNANQIRILQLCLPFSYQISRYAIIIRLECIREELWKYSMDQNNGFHASFGYNSAWVSIVLHAVVCLYRLSSSVTRVSGQPPPDRVLTGRYVHSTLISLFCMDLMLLQLVFSFYMSLSITVKTQRSSGQILLYVWSPLHVRRRLFLVGISRSLWLTPRYHTC